MIKRYEFETSEQCQRALNHILDTLSGFEETCGTRYDAVCFDDFRKIFDEVLQSKDSAEMPKNQPPKPKIYNVYKGKSASYGINKDILRIEVNVDVSPPYLRTVSRPGFTRRTDEDQKLFESIITTAVRENGGVEAQDKGRNGRQ